MMGEAKENDVYEEELLDYDEGDGKAVDGSAAMPTGEVAKKGYVGIHSSGFRDFLLKPELLRAIQDCGFEHPSEGKLLQPFFYSSATTSTNTPLENNKLKKKEDKGRKVEIREKEVAGPGEVSLQDWIGPSDAIEGYVPRR